MEADALHDLTAAYALDELVPKGAAVAVTQEKAGGTDAPTQTPFVQVKTSA